MKNISDYIAQRLVEANIIQEEDVSVCSYGLEVFFLTVLEFLSILVIALFVRNFIETLFFFLSFIPIRLYSGGYHANTRLRCYIILLMVYALFSGLLLITPTAVFPVSVFIMALMLFVIVIIFAPVTHKKNVSHIEMKHYKDISIVIILTEIFISIVGIYLWQNNTYIFCFALGQLTAALSIIAAVIKKVIPTGKNA